MARRKSRTLSRRRFLRNKKRTGKKRGGRADLLTPLLLLGAQQVYAGKHRRKGSKSHRTRRSRRTRRRN